MVPVGEADILGCSHVTVDVGRVRRQEVPLELVLQQHVVLRRQAKARSEMKSDILFLKSSVQHFGKLGDVFLDLSAPHDVFYACPLSEEGVHNGGPWRNERGFAEEGEQG